MKVGTHQVHINSKLSPKTVRKYVTGAYLGKNCTQEELADGLFLVVEKINGHIFISKQRKLF